MNSVPLVLVTLAAVLALSSAMRSLFPCHPNRNKDKIGAPCEGVFLPPRLCEKCDFSGFDSDGAFDVCDSIFKLEEPGCRAELERYSELNPCDTIRQKQLADFDEPDNRKGLDFFVYSLCEECCDCVPRGARSDDYDERKEAKTLTSLVRGFCTGHAQIDICKVLPEIRHVARPGRELKLERPKICPIMTEWIDSPAAEGWERQDNANITLDTERFLRNYNSVAGCRRKITWQRCTTLEVAQSRI